VEAADRLRLLNDSYYKDVLCDFGGFLAIANRVDRIHKNPWIGFQSWRATGRKVWLTRFLLVPIIFILSIFPVWCGAFFTVM
jgi:hypothetical protein